MDERLGQKTSSHIADVAKKQAEIIRYQKSKIDRLEGEVRRLRSELTHRGTKKRQEQQSVFSIFEPNPSVESD